MYNKLNILSKIQYAWGYLQLYDVTPVTPVTIVKIYECLFIIRNSDTFFNQAQKCVTQ